MVPACRGITGTLIVDSAWLGPIPAPLVRTYFGDCSGLEGSVGRAELFHLTVVREAELFHLTVGEPNSDQISAENKWAPWKRGLV